MLRRICATLSLPFIMLAGCGGTSSISDELRAIANCTGEAFGSVDVVFSGVMDVVAVIDNPGGQVPSNITYDSNDGTYAVGIDTDGDQQVDVTISGVIDSTDDLDDGLDDGESLSVSWTVAGANASGGGSFDISQANNTLTITGGGGIVTGDCALDLSNVSLSLDLANPEAIGSVDFETNALFDLLGGTINFDGGNVAEVVAEFLGAAASFDIDLDTYEVRF